MRDDENATPRSQSRMVPWLVGVPPMLRLAFAKQKNHNEELLPSQSLTKLLMTPAGFSQLLLTNSCSCGAE